MLRRWLPFLVLCNLLLTVLILLILLQERY
jgi:hypothetical protein